MKKFAFIVCLVLLAGTVAWSAGKQEAKAVEKMELTFWFSAAKPVVELMEKAVDEWNSENPNIIITLVETPTGRERMATAIAGGQGPEILMYNQNVTWFFGIDSVYPLNEFVQDKEIGMDGSGFRLDTRSSAHFGGKLVAIPFTGGGGSIKYNRRHFKEAGIDEWDHPNTWDEWVPILKKLTKFQADGKTPIQWGVEACVVDWWLQEAMFMNGGDWVNDDITEYCPYPENLAQSLQFWYDLTFKHRVMPVARGVSWVGAAEMAASEQGFLNEIASSQLCGHGGYTNLWTQNPNLTDNIGAFPIPRGPMAGDKVKISSGFWGPIIMSKCKNPREAYLFIKWLTENYSLKIAKANESVPAYAKKALEDPEWAESVLHGRIIKWFFGNLPRNFHVFPGRLDVRSEEPGMAEKVLLGKAAPKEAVTEFKKHATEVFKLHKAELDEYRANHKIIW